jgi:hypothetical protein
MKKSPNLRKRSCLFERLFEVGKNLFNIGKYFDIKRFMKEKITSVMHLCYNYKLGFDRRLEHKFGKWCKALNAKLLIEKTKNEGETRSLYHMVGQERRIFSISKFDFGRFMKGKETSIMCLHYNYKLRYDRRLEYKFS